MYYFKVDFAFENHYIIVNLKKTFLDEMHQICYESRQGNFLSKIQRTVDGVVLESRDERDEDCVITFQTESIVEKFLLKFERLQMDCNDHLYIYDGAHVAAPWRVGSQIFLSSIQSNIFH